MGTVFQTGQPPVHLTHVYDRYFCPSPLLQAFNSDRSLTDPHHETGRTLTTWVLPSRKAKWPRHWLILKTLHHLEHGESAVHTLQWGWIWTTSVRLSVSHSGRQCSAIQGARNWQLLRNSVSRFPHPSPLVMLGTHDFGTDIFLTIALMTNSLQ